MSTLFFSKVLTVKEGNKSIFFFKLHFSFFTKKRGSCLYFSLNFLTDKEGDMTIFFFFLQSFDDGGVPLQNFTIFRLVIFFF
jgi:hypothetical protein